MKLNPEIWGPKYWFFLHTVAINYSLNPSNSQKKKYYNFFLNFHLFIPDPEISKIFLNLLKDYPVSPYLDSRESLTKWVHFIHNRVNLILNKPILNYEESMIEYYNNYKTTKELNLDKVKTNDKLIFLSILILLLVIIIILSTRE